MAYNGNLAFTYTCIFTNDIINHYYFSIALYLDQN